MARAAELFPDRDDEFYRSTGHEMIVKIKADLGIEGRLPRQRLGQVRHTLSSFTFSAREGGEEM
jgi:hypothetical protein